MSKLEEQKALPRRRLFGPALTVQIHKHITTKLLKRKAKKAKGKR